jgi:hypothetical protein
MIVVDSNGRRFEVGGIDEAGRIVLKQLDAFPVITVSALTLSLCYKLELAKDSHEDSA